VGPRRGVLIGQLAAADRPLRDLTPTRTPHGGRPTDRRGHRGDHHRCRRGSGSNRTRMTSLEVRWCRNRPARSNIPAGRPTLSAP